MKIMKTISSLFLICIFSFSLAGQSPNYTDFEWDIARIGIAAPTSGDRFDSGMSVGTELRYNLLDNLSLGFRTELSFFVASEEVKRDENNVDVGLSHTIGLTTDYYFSTVSSRRAFVGLAIGNYSTGTVRYEDGDSFLVEDKINNSFGVLPRIGYELGHLRIEAQFNLPFNKDATKYFGLSAALTLWGGYQGK